MAYSEDDESLRDAKALNLKSFKIQGFSNWKLVFMGLENAKVKTCLRHHLQSPTLLSTPILNRVEYFEEPTRSYQTETPPAPQDEDEHEPMFIQPYDLEFVPEPIYPEYIPLEDEYMFLAEEQPLPPVGSPTVESPGYIAESDLKEDPKEYEDDETEDGPLDYPMDGGDDGDDDDDDLSGDNA
nr:hypothetical protein [Tanacetum cinerariifolium]